MDYHRYGGIGVGSVPSLLTAPQPPLGANGLPDHSIPPGAPQPAPPSISGIHSNLIASHHPSLMFHYGLAAKPPNIPPHLLSRVPPSATISNSLNIISTNCNLNSMNTNINSGSVIYSKASGSGINQSLASIPAPLGMNSQLPANTSASSSARSSSPNSSFAAALRSLAKQATGPPGSEFENQLEANIRNSPKIVSASSVASTNTGSSVISSSVNPLVTMAPTHLPHLSLHDMRKPPDGFSELEALSTVDALRGFQPYRPSELPTVSGASVIGGNPQPTLRPPIPMDIPHGYPPYSSLFSHHLTHQYRLEEQLFLERYGLLRPSMPPYGVGGLSVLYPGANASPYLQQRFPQELLPTSLAALHPSSALIHERLKLEEDIRQREYELEIRRERELEREREKEREREHRGREREREKEKEKEREREREKERDRRAKDNHGADKSKEEHKRVDVIRDRSPLSHPSAVEKGSGEAKISSTPSLPLQHSNSHSVSGVHSVSHNVVPKPAKISNEFASDLHSLPKESQNSSSVSQVDTGSKTGALCVNKPRGAPTIVRPFETTGVGATISSNDITVISHHGEDGVDLLRKTESKVTSDSETKKQVASSESSNRGASHKPFSVWQPVDLNVTNSEKVKDDSKILQPPSTTIPSRIPITISEGSGTGLLLGDGSVVSTTLNSQSTTVTSALSSTIVSTLSLSNSSIPHAPAFPLPYTHLPTFFPYNLHPFSSQVTQTTQSSLPSHPFLTTTQPPPIITSGSKALGSSSSVSTTLIFTLPANSITTTLPTTLTDNAKALESSQSQVKASLPVSVGNVVSSISPMTTCLIPLITSIPSSSMQISLSQSTPLTSSSTSPSINSPAVSLVSNSLAQATQNGFHNPIKEENLTGSEKPEKTFPVSRLDNEEHRLKELRATGMLAAEAEETLLEEALALPKSSFGALCTKGPPNPFEASNEKLSFLCSFGLTTHDEANKVELDRYERHAKAVTPLTSSRKDPISPNGWISAGVLAPMLAPGQNLSSLKKMRSPSLLVDFSKKCRFLHELGLDSIRSAAKQKEIDSIWKLMIEERHRRYCKGDSDDPLTLDVCRRLKKVLEAIKLTLTSSEAPSDNEISKGDTSLMSHSTCLAADSLISSNAIKLEISEATYSATVAKMVSASVSGGTNSTTGNPVWSFPITNSITTTNSLDKIQPALLKLGIKGNFEDGVLGIRDCFFPDPDPLLAGLPGLDQMIEHILQNAQAKGDSNSTLLLKHMEEVRRNQLLVCQTAQLVQEQVANLISSRAQLEAQRTALHHHLSSINSIIASVNSEMNSSTTTSSSSCGVEPSAPNHVTSRPPMENSMSSLVSNNQKTITKNSYTNISSAPIAHGTNSTKSSLCPNNNGGVVSSGASRRMSPARSIPLVSSAMGVMSVSVPLSAVVSLSKPNSALSTAVTWSGGGSSPFIKALNFSLSSEAKEATLYHSASVRDKKSLVTSSKVDSKINPVPLHANSIGTFSDYNNKIPNTSKNNTTKVTSKFNGFTGISPLQPHAYKSHINTIGGSTLVNKSVCNPKFGSNPIISPSLFKSNLADLGPSQHPRSTSNANSTNPLPIPVNSKEISSSAASSATTNTTTTNPSNKIPKTTTKSPIRYSPYPNKSPTKPQPWLQN